jgi:hypothetical protein
VSVSVGKLYAAVPVHCRVKVLVNPAMAIAACWGRE